MRVRNIPHETFRHSRRDLHYGLGRAAEAEPKTIGQYGLGQAFYNGPGTLPMLRRVCLCLRFSLHANSISSKKQRVGDVPPLVCLGRGDVQSKTSKTLMEIVGHLRFDTEIEVGEA